MLHAKGAWRNPPISNQGACLMGSVREEEVRARMKRVRTEAGWTQEAFVARLNAAAQQLYGDTAKHYRQDTLSKLEKPNGQTPTFDDVAVWAAVDPLRRGKLWLAWDEARDAATRPETLEEVSARTGIGVARRGQQFPAPESEKATRAGGQKGGKRNR